VLILTEHKDSQDLEDPTIWAILIGFFVWLIFDSFFYGILSGVIALVIFQQKETNDGDEP